MSEEALVEGTVNIVPSMIMKWISISKETMKLRGEPFIQYVYDELIYKIAKKAADNLIAKIEACGTVSTTTCPGVPKVTAASIAMGTVAAAIGNLSDEAAAPVIMMNKLTWSKFKAVKYANGFDADPFEGLPVEFNNKIKSFDAASTGETYVIVGDLDNGALMTLPDEFNIDFTVDNYTKATSGMVRIIGDLMAGLEVVNQNHFVKVTK